MSSIGATGNIQAQQTPQSEIPIFTPQRDMLESEAKVHQTALRMFSQPEKIDTSDLKKLAKMMKAEHITPEEIKETLESKGIHKPSQNTQISEQLNSLGKLEKRERMFSIAKKVGIIALGALSITVGLGLLATPAAVIAVPFLVGGIYLVGTPIYKHFLDEATRQAGPKTFAPPGQQVTPPQTSQPPLTSQTPPSSSTSQTQQTRNLPPPAPYRPPNTFTPPTTDSQTLQVQRPTPRQMLETRENDHRKEIKASLEGYATSLKQNSTTQNLDNIVETGYENAKTELSNRKEEILRQRDQDIQQGMSETEANEKAEEALDKAASEIYSKSANAILDKAKTSQDTTQHEPETTSTPEGTPTPPPNTSTGEEPEQFSSRIETSSNQATQPETPLSQAPINQEDVHEAIEKQFNTCVQGMAPEKAALLRKIVDKQQYEIATVYDPSQGAELQRKALGYIGNYARQLDTGNESNQAIASQAGVDLPSQLEIDRERSLKVVRDVARDNAPLNASQYEKILSSAIRNTTVLEFHIPDLIRALDKRLGDDPIKKSAAIRNFAANLESNPSLKSHPSAQEAIRHFHQEISEGGSLYHELNERGLLQTDVATQDLISKVTELAGVVAPTTSSTVTPQGPTVVPPLPQNLSSKPMPLAPPNAELLRVVQAKLNGLEHITPEMKTEELKETLDNLDELARKHPGNKDVEAAQNKVRELEANAPETVNTQTEPPRTTPPLQSEKPDETKAPKARTDLPEPNAPLAESETVSTPQPKVPPELLGSMNQVYEKQQSFGLNINFSLARLDYMLNNFPLSEKQKRVLTEARANLQILGNINKGLEGQLKNTSNDPEKFLKVLSSPEFEGLSSSMIQFGVKHEELNSTIKEIADSLSNSQKKDYESFKQSEFNNATRKALKMGVLEDESLFAYPLQQMQKTALAVSEIKVPNELSLLHNAVTNKLKEVPRQTQAAIQQAATEKSLQYLEKSKIDLASVASLDAKQYVKYLNTALNSKALSDDHIKDFLSLLDQKCTDPKKRTKAMKQLLKAMDTSKSGSPLSDIAKEIGIGDELSDDEKLLLRRNQKAILEHFKYPAIALKATNSSPDIVALYEKISGEELKATLTPEDLKALSPERKPFQQEVESAPTPKPTESQVEGRSEEHPQAPNPVNEDAANEPTETGKSSPPPPKPPQLGAPRPPPPPPQSKRATPPLSSPLTQKSLQEELDGKRNAGLRHVDPNAPKVKEQSTLEEQVLRNAQKIQVNDEEKEDEEEPGKWD